MKAAERETREVGRDFPKGWERCGACRGYGVLTSGQVVAATCRDCGGGGIVQCRDERGRFSRG